MRNSTDLPPRKTGNNYQNNNNNNNLKFPEMAIKTYNKWRNIYSRKSVTTQQKQQVCGM
jgi:hypothetical protein